MYGLNVKCDEIKEDVLVGRPTADTEFGAKGFIVCSGRYRVRSQRVDSLCAAAGTEFGAKGWIHCVQRLWYEWQYRKIMHAHV